MFFLQAIHHRGCLHDAVVVAVPHQTRNILVKSSSLEQSQTPSRELRAAGGLSWVDESTNDELADFFPPGLLRLLREAIASPPVLKMKKSFQEQLVSWQASTDLASILHILNYHRRRSVVAKIIALLTSLSFRIDSRSYVQRLLSGTPHLTYFWRFFVGQLTICQ
eukprot:TRINITY_DN19973_c0_g2_i1.p1 TRINITY_DN19973_c0_g2~~TRINITY_DN19973_c0_g2_i1.p1  ORF type:complete len:165 (+),score=19.83 TRINITY_DN19973_c0_g2_i1:219-713(+)